MHGMGAAGPGEEDGLQSAAEAMMHAAGLDPLLAEGIAPLPANAPANLRRWAPDVRALLLSQVVQGRVGHVVAPDGAFVSLTWTGNAIATLHRPSPATMAAQCDLVRHYADQRADRSAEIFSQMNAFVSFFGHLLGLTGARNPKTLELLALVPMLAGPVTMLPKHVFALRRPAELDVRVAPLIGTPGHGAFPSGHATQAMALAVVCEGLIGSTPAHFGDAGKRVELCYRAAQRIACNRTVAGVHFPMDSAAGARLGLQMGRVILGLCKGGTLADLAAYDANVAPAADYTFADTQALLAQTGGTPVPVAADPLWAWLWAEATREFTL